ncbi:hypothetical protein M8818_000536 [Zalaria obscura]|uniref:Uncharacterized protein n=1 Tax=Zalaria obscura TaxID=2024903 RepID=A0ACC3SQM9_9PEZI
MGSTLQLPPSVQVPHIMHRAGASITGGVDNRLFERNVTMVQRCLQRLYMQDLASPDLARSFTPFTMTRPPRVPSGPSPN